MTQAATPTVKAVVAYAAKLRRETDRKRALDPHYKGYHPTDSAARKLSQRYGPQEAIRRMAAQAVLLESAYEAQQAESAEARKRLQRAHTAELDRRRVARRRVDPLQRILDVRSALAQIPDAPAAQMGEITAGGGEVRELRGVTDHVAATNVHLMLCAERCEQILDRAHGLLPATQPRRESDEYARLDAWTGHTPEDIAAAHPNEEHLRNPTWIRAARRSMSLDPETGRHVRRTFTPDDDMEQAA